MQEIDAGITMNFGKTKRNEMLMRAFAYVNWDGATAAEELQVKLMRRNAATQTRERNSKQQNIST